MNELAWQQLLRKWAAPSLCGVAAVFCAIVFRDLRCDDAYITFRYAHNLASGLGFVFNPGERVFGTTTPLFTLLMALADGIVGPAIPQFAVAVSAIALGVQAFVVYRLLSVTLPATAALCALLLVGGLADSHGYFGLETNMTVALGLASVEAFRVGRSKLSGVLIGLAFLTRYDAILYGLLLTAMGLRDFRRRLLPCVLLAAIVVVPWLGFATYYFGNPLPHTLSAKLGITPFVKYVAAFLKECSALPGLEDAPLWARLPPALLLCANGLLVLLRRCPILLGFVLQGFLLVSVYAFIGAPSGQTWHGYGALLGFRLAAAVGVIGWLEERWKVSSRLVLAVGSVLAPLLAWRLVLVADRYRAEFWLGDRDRRYQIVAKFVCEELPDARSFMASEVGTLGYLTGRRMIDPYGLIDWTNDWPKTYRSESYAALVVHYRPDIILLDSRELAAKLERDAPSERYRLVKVFDWKEPWSTLVVRDPGFKPVND